MAGGREGKRPFVKGDRVALLVNNLGGATAMEVSIVARAALLQLAGAPPLLCQLPFVLRLMFAGVPRLPFPFALRCWCTPRSQSATAMEVSIVVRAALLQLAGAPPLLFPSVPPLLFAFVLRLPFAIVLRLPFAIVLRNAAGAGVVLSALLWPLACRACCFPFAFKAFCTTTAPGHGGFHGGARRTLVARCCAAPALNPLRACAHM